MAIGKTMDSGETNRLLAKLLEGDRQLLEALLVRHRPRLRRMVALRLDPRLRRRIDPSDVIQEACLEASTRLEGYLRSPTMPFFLWLRFLTSQKLITLHRHHLGVRMRDAALEVVFRPGPFPGASSAILADHFLDQGTCPSEAAMRAELRGHVRRALDGMTSFDREVLALRHFEQLSRAEIAAVLGISEAAAGKRYLRALEKLKQVLGDRDDSTP